MRKPDVVSGRDAVPRGSRLTSGWRVDVAQEWNDKLTDRPDTGSRVARRRRLGGGSERKDSVFFLTTSCARRPRRLPRSRSRKHENRRAKQNDRSQASRTGTRWHGVASVQTVRLIAYRFGFFFFFRVFRPRSVVTCTAEGKNKKGKTGLGSVAAMTNTKPLATTGSGAAAVGKRYTRRGVCRRPSRW